VWDHYVTCGRWGPVPRDDDALVGGHDNTPRQDPYLEIVASTNGPGIAAVRYVNYSAKYTLHWGDGTFRANSSPNIFYSHTYEPGTYTVAAQHQGATTAAATGTIWVKKHLRPVVTISEHPDGGPTQRLAFGADGPEWMTSTATVNWGDGSAEETVLVSPGQPVDHPYKAGTYTARLNDTLTLRGVEVAVTATEPTPDVTMTWKVAEDDSNRMTALVTLTKAKDPGRPLSIQWWDDSNDTDAVIGTEYRHTFPANHTGKRFFSYGYKDGDTFYAEDITLPLPGEGS